MGAVDMTVPASLDPQDAAQDAAIVTQVTATVPDVQAIYRFGSSAAGLATPDSDVDVAVLASTLLSPDTRFDLQERIAQVLRRSVDLVDLRAVSTVFAMQVVGTGLLIHDGETRARGAFEDQVYSAYARLNEERRGILERVAAEGSVYGR